LPEQAHERVLFGTQAWLEQRRNRPRRRKLMGR
jgi:hypothetical protein